MANQHHEDLTNDRLYRGSVSRHGRTALHGISVTRKRQSEFTPQAPGGQSAIQFAYDGLVVFTRFSAPREYTPDAAALFIFDWLADEQNI